MANFGIEGVEDSEPENRPLRVESLQAEDVLPKDGLHLSLDISSTSTGIAIWDGDNMRAGNIYLETNKTLEHGEALLRREFKSGLLDIIGGLGFNTVLVEDVFIGPYLQGVRWLFALNTVVDDLILDGEITCNTFGRVSNKEWKSWLRRTDPSRKIRGYNDKETINRLLENIGVTAEEGKGHQDRMDAMGLMIGYFSQELPGKAIKSKTKGSLKLSDIDFLYCSTYEEFEDKLPQGIERQVFKDRVSKRSILEALAFDEEVVWATSKIVSLGTLTTKIGVDPIPFGGYLAFWRK